MSAPDPGRQAERTVLAHLRTGLGVLVVGLLLARQGGAGIVVLVGGTLGVVAAAVAGAWRVREVSAGRTAAAPWALLVMVVAVAALQVAALAVVL